MNDGIFADVIGAIALLIFLAICLIFNTRIKRKSKIQAIEVEDEVPPTQKNRRINKT